MKYKLFAFKIDLAKSRSWRQEAYNVAEFDAWDNVWKKRLGWRAGLDFFKKTNSKRSWVLASRHWPHLLCWDWSIWLSLRKEGEGWGTGVNFSRQYRYGVIFLLGNRITLNWQDSGHMPAIGPVSNGAPRILWNHHLDAAKNLEPKL